MNPLKIRIKWPDGEQIGEVEFELSEYDDEIEIDLCKLPRSGEGDFRILGNGEIIPIEHATVN